MKTIFSLILSILISTTSIAQTEITTLFIGNSYTFVNDLPGIINDIAQSKGNTFNHQSHTPGGSTLAQHAFNSNVQNLLTSEVWDYVILQDQSQNPSFPPSQVANEVYPYAASLCEDIRQADACSQPVFFMTWGRENGDAQNCDFYPPLCTYEGMQDRLTESYTEMAEDNNSLLAPVGIAWKSIRESHPNINLYSSDGSHPSIHGSYLAACTFYATLFLDNPINSFIPQGITIEEALIIQETAYNTTLQNDIDFTIQAQAIVTYELIGDSMCFYNESINSTFVQWLGITQNEVIISTTDTLSVYIGDFTDEYEIRLLVTDGCTESTITLQINELAIDNLKTVTSIFPNPSTGLLNYKGESNLLESISVYNTLGVCVYNTNEIKTNSWDFSYFNDGLYFIELCLKNTDKKYLNWIKKN